MAKIINIKCIQCKEEFITEPYFCNIEIYHRNDGYAGTERYLLALSQEQYVPIAVS